MGTIEAFFNHFPKKKYLSQFKPEHIDDWAVERKRQGKKATTLAIELSRVRKFWNWCREDRGMKVLDVIEPTQRKLARTHRVPKKKAFNSVQELKAVFNAIKNNEVKWYVLTLLTGLLPKGYKVPTQWRTEFRSASRRVGLDHRLSDLYGSIPKLRLWVLQNLYQQMGEALLVEPKLDSNPQTTINIPASNVWPTVIDSGNYTTPVIGINQLN
jgi:hypothetical protein